MNADDIQSRIDLLISAVKLLVVIAKFALQYFPNAGDENDGYDWHFYNGIGK